MGSMFSSQPLLKASANVNAIANVHKDAVQVKAEEKAVSVETDVNAHVHENAIQLNTAPGTVDVNTNVNAQATVKEGAVNANATMEKDAVKVEGTVKDNTIKFTPTLATNINIGGDTVPMVTAMIVVMMIAMSNILGLMTTVAFPLLIIGVIAKEACDGFPRVTGFNPQLKNLLPKNQIENSVNGGEVNVPPPALQKQPVFSELVQSKIRDPAIPFTVEERIEFVAECIEKGDANAKAVLKSPASIVMVLGNTGAGKSTLINYIFGCKMIEEKQGLGKVISVDEGKGNNPSIVSIGNTNESATFLPFVSKVPNSNLAIVDNAGFCDNRGSEFNIVNAVNMVSAMSHSRSIGILLCIEYSAFLAQRAQGIKSLSSTLKSIFDDNVLHEHSASFLVCVTKTPSDCDFKELERTLRKSLSEEKLPKSIADSLFIYDPTEQQKSDAAKTRDEILDILKQAPKINPTECEYNPPLTDTDKIALEKITNQMGKKVISHLEDDKLDDALACLKILDQLKQIGGSTIQKLLEEVRMKVGGHYNSKAEEVKGLCTKALLSVENGSEDPLQQVEEIKKRAQTTIFGPLKSLKTILPDVDVHHVNEAMITIEDTSTTIKERLRKMSKAASPQLLDCKRKSDTSFDIEWNIPTSHTPIKGYELSLNNSIQTSKVSDPKHTIKDLLPGQDYEIKVRAVNDAGAGGWSNVLNVKTTSTKPSMRPKNLKVTNVKDDSFTLSWQKPEVKPGETEIQSYVVTKDGVPIFDDVYPVELRLRITNLKANTKYKIGICATNLAGSGPEAIISKTTSNRIQVDIDKKQKELAPLDREDEIIVHTKGYDENDSDIFTLTHIGDKFDCDYKISKVSGPSWCNTFAPKINETGCSWRGNSQVNGRVIGEVKVYARTCDKHWKEIKGLKKEIEGLEAKARAIAENAYE